jgi:hypothetical protein
MLVRSSRVGHSASVDSFAEENNIMPLQGCEHWQVLW